MRFCKWQDENGIDASKMHNLTAIFSVSVGIWVVSEVRGLPHIILPEG